MIVRLMTDDDLPQMTRIAERGLEFDLLTEDLVREKTLGAKLRDPELGLVVENSGKVCGFAQGVIGGELEGKKKGTVRLFCVDRAHRRSEAGTVLFDEMEKRLKTKGAEVATIMDCPPNYLTPGVDFRYTETYCFLLDRGYRVFRENHNLVCDLHPDKWPDLDRDVDMLISGGLEVRRAVPEDESGIVDFLNQEWKAWVPEVAGALENDPAGVFIALHEGKVVAFAAYQGNNKALPFFGPMGTSPLLRGRGAGAILLRLCLRELARQGWGYAIIPWVGPVGFYARYCDAKIDRCFWAYRKDL